MHFAKTLVSAFALASFTSAFSSEIDEHVDALAAREEEYLQARDNYIMEKRGGTASKIEGLLPVGRGKCEGFGEIPRPCVKYVNGKKERNCGPCKAGAAYGTPCRCKY